MSCCSWKKSALLAAASCFVPTTVCCLALAAGRRLPFGSTTACPSIRRASPARPTRRRPTARGAVFERLAFASPLYIIAEPGDDRLLVVEWHGRVLAFANDPNTDKSDTFCRVDGYETYGVTFHPDYAHNGYVYFFCNGPESGKEPRRNRIFRYQAKGKPRVCEPRSRLLVIEWASDGHNGGDLAFGPDGCLYITSGDGSGDSDRDLTGQDLRDLCSGVLRIDVIGRKRARLTPSPGTTLFSTSRAASSGVVRIRAAQPLACGLDRRTGTFWIGDVGQDLWESIRVLKRGANYGWSVYEGGHPFYLNRQLGPGPVEPPVVAHHHRESRLNHRRRLL